MNQAFTEFTKTGDIVIQFPMASRFLTKYKIDYCCGGDAPIGEAIDANHLNKTEVLHQLNELYDTSQSLLKETVDWKEKSYVDLINHVVNVHHAYLHLNLPELSGLVEKIHRVHGDNHPELAEVDSLFHKLKAKLEDHSNQEEEVVFPSIQDFETASTASKLTQVLETLDAPEDDHEGTGHLLKKIRNVTQDYQLPQDACGTYRLTFAKLEELESDLFEHIHLENNVLFSRLKEEHVV